MTYPAYLLDLVQSLQRLPGVGSRTAERFAFQMMDWPTDRLHEMSDKIRTLPELLKLCEACGCLLDDQECPYCDPSKRTAKTLCVVATPKDVFAFEETGEYRGFYHVLGGLLSPLEGKGPESLSIEKLKERIAELGVQEVILALDSTLEGDATALFLKQEMEVLSIPVSRLAFGLPMGSPLDYVDGGTLARALSGRNQF